MKTAWMLVLFNGLLYTQAAKLKINNAEKDNSVRIVGGEPATATQFPCGSSGFTVFLGSVLLSGAGGQQFRVPAGNIFTHPGWDYVNISNDICLLQLPSPATLSDTVKPIGLMPADAGDLAGNNMTISGWGLTSIDDTSLSSILNWATVKAITNTECGSHALLDPGQICASTMDGTSACGGDSGGPLVDIATGLLAGVISYGQSDYCEVGTPQANGFARISYYYDWIVGITGPLNV